MQGILHFIGLIILKLGEWLPCLLGSETAKDHSGTTAQ
jgi:hypothetical protein